MSDQNPYAVTEVSDVAATSPPVISKYNLSAIARYRKLTDRAMAVHVFGIVWLVIGNAMTVLPEAEILVYEVPAFMVFLSYVVMVGTAMLLAVHVSETKVAVVFLIIPSLVPCVGWFIAGGIRSFAGSLLQQHGYRLGWNGDVQPPDSCESS